MLERRRLVGDQIASLRYGAGWLRPEGWLLEPPDVLAGHLAVAGVACVFGLAALDLSGRSDRRPLTVAHRKSG